MGEPVVDIAIEQRHSSDRDRLKQALARVADDDPECRVKIDAESGQAIVSGQDEHHLVHLIERLKAAGVELNVGTPQVAYRETITRTVERDYVHKKQSYGGSQFARIKFRIEPGGGPQFVAVVAEGNLPAAYILAVQTGVASVMGSGPVIGFPIVGEAQGAGCLVVALVPVATIFGYASSLRALSSGAGRYTMRFSHYAEVPGGADPDDRFPPAVAMRA